MKMKNLKHVKWEVIITNGIAVFALLFSVYSHFENIRLQEKYNALSTYGMDLNYQVEISDQEGKTGGRDYFTREFPEENNSFRRCRNTRGVEDENNRCQSI